MRIGSQLRTLVHYVRGQGVEVDRHVWESEYERGDWRYLRELGQMPRNAVVAGYLRHFRPDAAVLDIGCGEGVLQRLLAPDGYRCYVGIDLSERAIETARAQADDRCQFVQSDASTWQPPHTFDVVVFNEALYYFRDPIAVLRRYEAGLKEDGLIIVSMYARMGHTNMIWRSVMRHATCLHRTDLRSDGGRRWSVRVFDRPSALRDPGSDETLASPA